MPSQPAASPQFLQFELPADPDYEDAPEHAHDAVDEAFFVFDGAFRSSSAAG